MLKHRGVKIVRSDFVVGIDIGNPDKDDGYVKNIMQKAYSPIGMSYPESLSECKATIDRLIERCMTVCAVGEKEAIGLLNDA